MIIFLNQQQYFEIAISLKAGVKLGKFKYYKQNLPFHYLKKLSFFNSDFLINYFKQYFDYFLKYFLEAYLSSTYSKYLPY